MNALQTLLSPVVNGARDTNEQAILCSTFMVSKLVFWSHNN